MDELKQKKIRVRDVDISFYIPNQLVEFLVDTLEQTEPEILDWIDSFEKDALMFDIGASFGPYSIYAGIKNDIQSVAFEAEAQNYAILEMNHFFNQGSIKHSILAFNLAISDSNGLGKMYCKNYLPGRHEKILDQAIDVMSGEEFNVDHVQSILKKSLDSIIEELDIEVPDYIKIDVDGAEYNVLKGAKKTLLNPKVKSIYIEIKESEDNKKILELLESYGWIVDNKFPVLHPSGGTYEGLFNIIMKRTTK